jgi:hypothetical protein
VLRQQALCVCGLQARKAKAVTSIVASHEAHHGGAEVADAIKEDDRVGILRR